MPDRLQQILQAQVDGSCDFPDAGRDRLLERVMAPYGGGVLAVLIYGSYLRGRRDTLLDFYVLLDSYRFMPRRWQACTSAKPGSLIKGVPASLTRATSFAAWAGRLVITTLQRG